MDKITYLEHRIGKWVLPIYDIDDYDWISSWIVIKRIHKSRCCWKSNYENKIIFSFVWSESEISNMKESIRQHMRAIKEYVSNTFWQNTYMTVVSL